MSGLKQLQQQQLDFQKVSPLDANRLVTFINHFTTSIVEQLNEFASTADTKLHQLNNKINICHANLVILEMKLSSISGLSSVGVSQPPKVQTEGVSSESSPSLTSQVNAQAGEKEETSESKTEVKQEQQAVDVVVEEEEEPRVEEKEEDPRLIKYKKMFQVGVPLDAVHQKMISEGVDPSLLKV